MPGGFLTVGSGGGGGAGSSFSFFLGMAMAPLSPAGPPASGAVSSGTGCCCCVLVCCWEPEDGVVLCWAGARAGARTRTTPRAAAEILFIASSIVRLRHPLPQVCANGYSKRRAKPSKGHEREISSFCADVRRFSARQEFDRPERAGCNNRPSRSSPVHQFFSFERGSSRAAWHS